PQERAPRCRERRQQARGGDQRACKVVLLLCRPRDADALFFIFTHSWLDGWGVAHGRQCSHYSFGGERDDHLGAFAEFRTQCETSAMSVAQTFHDRKSESRALLSALDRIRTLAEGRKHDRDFFLWNSRPGIAHTEILPSRSGPSGLDPDLSALWRKFDRIGEKIETNLANSTLVGPKFR